jgi:TetR/AcrR family fatty acid metabolism transcriptional regulator
MEFDEALQGIEDARSRLSRWVWYSLRYNDRHPGYVKTLFFDCRFNPRFYSSRAYELIRKHAAITIDILHQGVADGSFRDDINMGLIRDIIYGTLELEAINAIRVDEVDETIHDFDAIMGLLIPMICKTTSAPAVKREEKLLSAAEAVFAKHGFEKAKISEIAQLAGGAGGSVYDYFKSKEDLLLSIPLKRFQNHLEQLPETFQIISPTKKLRRLLRYYFTLFFPNQEFPKVFVMDVMSNRRFYDSEAYRIFQKYLRVIEEVIEEGKSKKRFRPDVNPRVFRNMFLGAFIHVALRWIIFRDKKAFDKMMEINHLVDLFSSSVVQEMNPES